MLKNYNIGILTVLLRKEAYDSVLGFNDQSQFSGDFDLIIRLSSKWKFSCSQEALAFYRVHEGNFSNMFNVNNVIEIEELEKWISGDKIVSDNNLKPHLHYIRKRINFLKTMKYINEWQLVKAIKNIFFLPLGLLKIKLILYIILPKKILNMLKKY